MRSRYLVAGLACIATAAVAVDQQQQLEVGEVVVEGCKTVYRDRIYFILGTRAGKKLDQAVLADDLRAVEKMGPFTNTRAKLVFPDPKKPNLVTVVFEVTELPYVGAVRFAKVPYFQRSGVEKVIETKTGSYLNPLILENDRRAVQAFFQGKYYQNAKITVDSTIENNVAIVTFTCDLGREIEVGKVIYQGLPPGVFPRRLNNDTVINGPGKTYAPEMVPYDEGALARAIADEGYLQAKVGTAKREWFDFIRPHEERRRHGPLLVPDDALNDRVALTYDVTPGERWYLGRVSFVDNTVASEEEMRREFALAEGVAYRRVDIDRAVERARRLISNQGYARAFLRKDEVPNPQTHRIDLTLHVFEGDLYSVGRIDIHGNYLTKDAVIRRAVRIGPGDLWNDDHVDDSKRQIQRTGLFKVDPQHPLRIEPHFDNDRPGIADVVVDVNEDSTGSLRLQGGYSSSFGLFAEIKFAQHNFDLWGLLSGGHWLGAGHILEADASWSSEATSVSASFTNPHVMDGPYSFSLDARILDSTLRDWEEIRTSSTIGLGRSFLDNDLMLSVFYTYTNLRVKNVQSNAPNDALDGAGDYYLNTVGLTQSYDLLDNRRLPTRGIRLTANEAVTGTVLSASTNYFDYKAQADAFVPLHTGEEGGVTFLHFSQRWRQLLPLGDSDSIPFYSRIFGGGSSPFHRGFQYGDLTPHELNRNGVEARLGGTSDSLFTAELSIPLQKTNEGIRLVLFTDYGNVWGQGEKISLGDMRTAVGFGIRFPIQLPVALDFAWLLDAKQGESDSQIHFSLGFFAF